MRSSLVRHAGIAILLLSAIAGACRRESLPPLSSPPVILISIDTLRSDRLPMYGYRGVETPQLDRFRRDAVLYHRAYAPTPMTLPSHVTMLTGLLPHRHGVRNNVGFHYDGERFPSVGHLLRAVGYATGAAVSSYVLRGETGLRRSFADYDDAIDPHPGAAFGEYQRRGDLTAGVAARWIAQRAAAPFFYFLHLYEPHVPYEPPEPWRSRYADPYDGEIAAADAIVGSFLDELRRRGVYDRALIIVTSDHGEGLGDHGEEQHSVLIYREVLQVPLLIKYPANERAGSSVAEPVQLADLAPTILEVAGVRQGRSFDGVSLARGAIPGDRAIYGESLFPLIHLGWSELRSLIRGRHHFIEAPKPELYDLIADPAERVNLVDSERRVATALRSELQSVERGEVTPSSVDPETARKLGALGYLGAPASAAPRASRLNPIEHIDFLNQIRRAFEMAASGRGEEAVPLMRAMLASHPDALEVRLRLAEVLADELRNEEAVREYREALARSPVPLPDVSLQAASLLVRMGRFDEAEISARAALSDLPVIGNEVLARVAIGRNDLAAATRYAEAAFEAGRSAAQLVLRAEVARRGGDFAGALALLDQSEKQAASRGATGVYRLHALRADTYAQTGRIDEAIDEYRKEIALYPANLDAWAGLAVLHFLRGELPEADRLMSTMVEKNPGGRAREIAARTYEVFGEASKARRWRAGA